MTPGCVPGESFLYSLILSGRSRGAVDFPGVVRSFGLASRLSCVPFQLPVKAEELARGELFATKFQLGYWSIAVVEVVELAMVSCWGPRPSLMRARESGVILVCQPLSAWSFSMAAADCASQTPEGSPVR